MTKYMTKTATHATLASVIFPGTDGANTLLAAYNVTSDKAGALLLAKMSNGVVTAVDVVSAITQKVLSVAATTGFTSGDIIVIQRANDTTERHVVDSVQAGVSLTLIANLAAACAVGDKVYEVTTQASVAVGAATVSATATGPWGLAGTAAGPVLFDCDGTAAVTLNYITMVVE